MLRVDIESNANPDAIILPANLGLRSAASAHFPSGVSSPPPPSHFALTPSSQSQSEFSTTLLSSFLASQLPWLVHMFLLAPILGA